MGLFTKTDRNGQIYPRVGRIAGASVTAVFGAAALLSSVYVNEAREVSLEVSFGQVTDVVTEPGVNWKTPFVAQRFGYSLARQTTRIGEATTLRTSDDVRLSNPFTIEYKIDENADLQNLYFQLKGSGEDLQDVIQKLASDVAVRVFEGLQVTDLAEEGITDQITQGIQTRLQADLNSKGWPVQIIDVLSDGFNLSPESEGVLERIIDIRQEAARLELREQNAIKAEEVLRREAQAYVAYANELRAAGMPEADIRCAIYDKMAMDSGRIMEPFAQVCGGSGETFDIAVPTDAANDVAPAARAAAPRP